MHIIIVIDNYCPNDPAAECAGTCAAPSEFQRVVDTEVTLTCLEGYQTRTGAGSFVATCIQHTDDAGVWNLEDHCVGIPPHHFQVCIFRQYFKFLFYLQCQSNS